MAHFLRPRTLPFGSLRAPLFVPSYSSRGFHDLKRLFQATAADASECLLISAFDLSYETLPIDATSAADFTFIDSGTYEFQANNGPYSTQPWSREKHEGAITNLPGGRYGLIAYDAEASGSAQEQIELGLDLKGRFPGYPVDLVLKPSEPFRLVETTGLTRAEGIDRIDIIGITEDEMGESFLERCTRIRKLRQDLDAAGLHMPIHILGCLDPTVLVGYTLAGAEIFDGLQWLRWSFTPQGIIRNSSVTVQTHAWEQKDRVQRVRFALANLATLRALRLSLERFAKTGEATGLPTFWSEQTINEFSAKIAG